MKFILYYTMMTGDARMDCYSAEEALAAHETIRLAGGSVTKIVDMKGADYTIADLERLAMQSRR